MRRANIEALYVKGAETECWTWVGCLNHRGYGQLTHKQKRWTAHRFFYTTHVGPIPPGLLVCHTCDNRRCVNPAHLFLGTPKDNTQDMMRKGRHVAPRKEACLRGHPLSGENLYVSPDGSRACRTCQLDRSRRYEKTRFRVRDRRKKAALNFPKKSA